MDHNRFGRTVKTVIVAVCVALLTLSAFGIGVNVGSHTIAGAKPARAAAAPAVAGTDQAPSGDSSTELVDMTLLREAWALLQKQFYGNLPAGKEITYDVIRGLVGSLGDKHTAFLDPQNAAIANAMMEGHFEGIGAQVNLAEGGGVLIEYIYPGQPADKAGVLVGDIVVAVDGQNVTELDLNTAISKIRGPAGTQVKLTVKRDDKQPFDITVTRARVEIPVVKTETLANGRIAYIALNEFSGVAPGRMADALKNAIEGKPDGVIFDLRGNPGGFLDAAVRVGSYFVPDGSIVIERFKDGTEHVYNRQGSYMLGKLPLVVLVDSGSASASEIVAGAIQDAGTGVLIGEKTYGKGSVQLVNSLSDGSQLRITVAHWFTPKNRGIHETGLEPDVAVPLSKEDAGTKRDPQLERAIKWLQGDHSIPATPAPKNTVSPSGPVLPTATPTSGLGW